MKLLDTNEIKEDKKETALQSRKIIISLVEEESKINKELNLIKENAKIQKIEIKKETDEFIRIETEKRNNLEKEVVILELRKKEALKPIIDVQNDAEKAINEAKQAISDIEKKKMELDKVHEENTDLAEELLDRKNELDERDREISKKESRIENEEKRLKESARKLSDDWFKFSTSVIKSNEILKKREQEVSDREKILDIKSKNQEERDIEQNKRDLLLRDKYSTFERAVARFKK